MPIRRPIRSPIITTSILAILAGGFYAYHTFTTQQATAEQVGLIAYAENLHYTTVDERLTHTIPSKMLAQTYGEHEGIYVGYKDTPETAGLSPFVGLIVKDNTYTLALGGVAHHIDDLGVELTSQTYPTYQAAAKAAHGFLPATEPHLYRG